VAVTAARSAALEVLRQVGRGRRLDLAFPSAAGALAPQDRRWIHELVYGVSRLRGRLDYLLGRHVRGGLSRLSAPLLDVLRSGAYQLLYMRSVPAYAAVSQAVEQARAAVGAGGASLTNAVLRRVADDGESLELFPDARTDPVGFLSTWGSHPRWLVERWLARWSFVEVRTLVELGNRAPPLVIVPLDVSPAEAVRQLSIEGVEAREVGRGTEAVEITGDAHPTAVLKLVNAAVQDAGSALVPVYADVPRGARAADLCAAPGGKTLALTRRASYVLAADRSLARLRLLAENLRRTERHAGLVLASAEEPPIRGVDFLLLDVPCTGTGTFRRHPDARWRLSIGDVAKLAGVQRRMLDAAARVVPARGILVYSTCTLEPEENEEQVAAFLAAHQNFALESTGTVEPVLLDGGRLRVLPQRTGFDGAFAARLRRAG
jgi:16S rRNA (cytosine967-C5)-methyltransferase